MDRAARNKSREGRRRGSPEQSSRGGALPKVANLGPPGANLSGGKAREAQYGTRNPLVPNAGSRDALGGGCCAGGGPTGRGSPACGVLYNRGCCCLRDLAQRKRGVERVLTVYGIGQRCRAAAPVLRSCGVGAVAIAEGAPGCSSGRQDPRVRLLDARGYSYGGSGGLEGGGTVGQRRCRGTARRRTAKRGGGGARVWVGRQGEGGMRGGLGRV